jgi:hypothetical protein
LLANTLFVEDKTVAKMERQYRQRRKSLFLGTAFASQCCWYGLAQILRFDTQQRRPLGERAGTNKGEGNTVSGGSGEDGSGNTKI